LQPFADGRDENSVGFIEAQPAMNTDKMTAETSAFVPILTLPGSGLDNRRTRNVRFDHPFSRGVRLDDRLPSDCPAGRSIVIIAKTRFNSILCDWE